MLPKQFKQAVGFASEILKREIKKAEAEIEGSKITNQEIRERSIPEILILEQPVEYKEEVAKEKSIKFVIIKGEDDWIIKSARDNPEDYGDRAKMPENWQGLRDEALQKESGIKDAVFCIKGGWFGKAKTKEAVIEMAKKSLGIR